MPLHSITCPTPFLRPAGVLAGALVAVLAAGCATSFDRLNPFAKKGPHVSQCSDDQPYRDTTSVPPLHPARGVEPPVSQAALRIPEPPDDPVPFKQPVVENGISGTRCLDQPPPMTPAAGLRVTTPAGNIPPAPVPAAGSAAAPVTPSTP